MYVSIHATALLPAYVEQIFAAGCAAATCPTPTVAHPMCCCQFMEPIKMCAHIYFVL